jgi:y4mF family transcriptional regulator
MATSEGHDEAARIAAFVARRRRELGVTQNDLAELAGVSPRSVSAIEAGKPTMRLDILLPVLATLGVDVVERIERA